MSEFDIFSPSDPINQWNFVFIKKLLLLFKLLALADLHFNLTPKKIHQQKIGTQIAINLSD